MAAPRKRTAKTQASRDRRARTPVRKERMAFRFALPGCECRHVNGLGEESMCEAPAALRVTVVCRVRGCDCAARVYLLCGECTDIWRERARDPEAPELRITPF